LGTLFYRGKRHIFSIGMQLLNKIIIFL
jgi:hypothetical protein